MSLGLRETKREPEVAGGSQENQTARQLTRQDLRGSMFHLDDGLETAGVDGIGKTA